MQAGGQCHTYILDWIGLDGNQIPERPRMSEAQTLNPLHLSTENILHSRRNANDFVVYFKLGGPGAIEYANLTAIVYHSSCQSFTRIPVCHIPDLSCPWCCICHHSKIVSTVSSCRYIKNMASEVHPVNARNKRIDAYSSKIMVCFFD